MADFDLPLLDFDLFHNGTPEERLQLGEALVESFIKHGFVRLRNHGITDEMVQNIWKWEKKFFAMTEEQKLKIYHAPGPDPQRGWSKKGLETTSKLRKENYVGVDKSKTTLLDEKEHFDCGPKEETQFPNLFPDEDLPGFREFVYEYFEAAQNVCLDIMRACEVGFHMETGTLVEKCIPAASELRMLYYPEVAVETLKKGLIKRAWPHTDFGIITLLFQDGLGGLECEDRRKPFSFAPVPVNPGENVMVVNTSDTFTRWTNKVVTGGLHQVNTPPGLQNQQDGSIPERYSSVFFFKAHRGASVGPIKHFVTEENPAHFPDITALDFHREMTKILY
ncbi:putative gibberellin 20-oxidase [Patellaria atrata CBS 101060]|uniref:Gibberellin 20-oxidase n=1 Tax=Patellaria atrata CBS 101060 TaxID=1346257 RepID=A0A9P4SBQ6_9PEZI|nr:putative gibberellin 20-oxidase [Patellaria atrata CBS 101060]